MWSVAHGVGIEIQIARPSLMRPLDTWLNKIRRHTVVPDRPRRNYCDAAIPSCWCFGAHTIDVPSVFAASTLTAFV